MLTCTIPTPATIFDWPENSKQETINSNLAHKDSMRTTFFLSPSGRNGILFSFVLNFCFVLLPLFILHSRITLSTIRNSEGGCRVAGFLDFFYFLIAGVVGVIPPESRLLVGAEYVNAGLLGQSS